MVLVMIPLVGIIDLDKSEMMVIAMSLGIVLDKPLKVSEEVWLELIRRKYSGRYRNIDDPLREALGLPIEEKQPVKRYSDESDENGAIQV